MERVIPWHVVGRRGDGRRLNALFNPGGFRHIILPLSSEKPIHLGQLHRRSKAFLLVSLELNSTD